MHYCPAFAGIAIKSELDKDGKKLLSRLRCKSWSCPYCSQANRSRWRAFLLDVLPAVSEIWSFHTITLPDWVRKNKTYTDEDRTLASLSLIRGNWDKLIKRLKRQLGAFEYFRVFEKHSDGILHAHILISHHIPENELKGVVSDHKRYTYWRWLKDNLPQCGFGYMTSSENLEQPQKAVGYATKYMTKEDYFVSDIIAKYRIRRFQSSQGIGSQEDWGKDDNAWIVRTFIDAPMARLQTYHDCNTNNDITAAHFGAGGVYPSAEDYQKSDAERKRRAKLKA